MPTPDEIIDAAAEQVDQRNLWRRKEDVRRNALVIGLATLLITIGVAWGTAQSTVAQKVDRSEFQAHVYESDRRFLADSLQRVSQAETLRRIEGKVDSTNARLSRFICDKKPAYCQ